MSRRTGQLLIASRRLVDPNFVRTVLLIVQQDESGVIGLILNRPLDVTVADACDPSAEEAASVQEKLYQGGPCPGPLMVLHADAAVGGTEIVAGVRFTAERERIQCLMRGGNGGPVRYYAGYAGWSPSQLEDEIEEGAWLLSPASADVVFNDAHASQWSALTTRLTVGKWIDVDRMPEDPTTN